MTKEEQKYKIYVNEVPFTILSKEVNPEFSELQNYDLIFNYRGKVKTLRYLMEQVEAGAPISSVLIWTTNMEGLIRDFKTLATTVEAAGGLVKNELDEYLFIFRRGHWDMPKGKLEKNETKKQTAVREVEEETGAKNLAIGDKLGVTYHTFISKNGNRILKKSHWYKMYTKKQKLIPQTNEDITKAAWMTLEKFSKCKPAYGNILTILEAYKSTLPLPKDPSRSVESEEAKLDTTKAKS